MEEQQRFYELDSLRGLAALIVFFYHGLILTVWNTANPLDQTRIILDKLFNHFPLSIFNTGQQSVVFFFMLSGFVLALPFCNNKAPKYSTFIIKRICRIYIPYIIAVFVGVIMRYLFSYGEISGLWGGTIDHHVILSHILLIGELNQSFFDPVIWSLVVEMRVAIIFPFLVMFVVESSWRNTLIVGFLVSCAGIILHSLNPLINFNTNYYDTIHFCFVFMIGAVLAKHNADIRLWYRSLNIIQKISIVVFGYCLYTFSSVFSHRLEGNPTFQFLATDWFASIGGAIFIVVGLNSSYFSKILLIKPLKFIGKISFSLYLYHLIFFLTWISILHGNQHSRILIWAATLSFYFVEKPSIKLGKLITQSAKK